MKISAVKCIEEIAEAVGAGTAVENSWSVGCQKPLFWLTVLLQLGTILTYSGNIYHLFICERPLSELISESETRRAHGGARTHELRIRLVTVQ